MSSVYQHMEAIRRERGAGFIVLVDPDKLDESRIPELGEICRASDVDLIFIGGSLIAQSDLHAYITALKQASGLPVIGFPGSLNQLSGAMDAVLYLSVISGRNPDFLFGQHVYAAPVIRRLGLEPIPTGYMLVESGRSTTAQYMSHSWPLPRHKPDVAAATALAAEMMGMKLLFTDAGSGAENTVPEDMIGAIRSVCTIPLVVGGGITTPEEVSRKIAAGACYVVVGNAIERNNDGGYISELAAAAHIGVRMGA